jgi:hypothetical protein
MKGLQASELRIGNSAKLFLGIGDSGPEYREVVITGLKTDRDQRIRIDNSDYWHPMENFEPIPLTKEWLIKFWFIKTESKNTFGIKFHEHSLHELFVTISNPNIATIGDSYATTKKLTVFTGDVVSYVHQLQNLYFALTGKELA